MGSSGSKRHLMYVKKNNSSTDLDEYGRVVESSTTFATVKGSLVQLSGNERTVAEQAFGFATHQSKCWYVPGITNHMWIECLNGKRFNIVDVNDIDNKNRELLLTLASESS